MCSPKARKVLNAKTAIPIIIDCRYSGPHDAFQTYEPALVSYVSINIWGHYHEYIQIA